MALRVVIVAIAMASASMFVCADVMAGGGGASGAGLVSAVPSSAWAEAERRRIRSEYRQDLTQIWLEEASVVSVHVFKAATSPHAYVVSWVATQSLRAAGIIGTKTPEPTIMRMAAPLVPGYSLMFSAKEAQ